MPDDIESILQITTQGLEKQQHLEHPATGVNGHLYFLLKALAECTLTVQQQEQMKRIIVLHKQCVYGTCPTSQETRRSEKGRRSPTSKQRKRKTNL